MIRHPVGLALVLIAIVSGVTLFSKTSGGRRFFKFLPVPFYCYFIPILGATAGFLPAESPLYKILSQHVLPPCLILLLLGSPWADLFRLGRQGIVAMGIGSAGMFLGAVIGYAAIGPRLPENSWMAAGALLGSWTGGTANMMAVKEALNMPESLLAPIVIVDTLIAYSWMALLIALAGFQSKLDLRLNADRQALDRVEPEAAGPDGASCPFIVSDWILMVAVAVGCGEAALYAGKMLAKEMPALNLNAMAWTVILATTIGLLFSLTPVRHWEKAGASRAGTTVLLLLLTSYGAQTNLRAIVESPAFVAFGAIMVGVHGLVLVAFGRVFRLPLFYLATASQACIGGPVSTPIVAGVYQPTLTHVGVILALLGGAIGTYIGLLGAAVCRWIG